MLEERVCARKFWKVNRKKSHSWEDNFKPFEYIWGRNWYIEMKLKVQTHTMKSKRLNQLGMDTHKYTIQTQKLQILYKVNCFAVIIHRCST